MATRLAQLYEEDFYAWTKDQAKALARLKEARPNEAIDWDHLVEEVRDLGKSERDTCRSHLMRVMEHLLKLTYSPASEPRPGWIDTVGRARVELELKITPALRRDLSAVRDRLYKIASREARRGLAAHGEQAAAAALPETCPYTLTQLLNPDWWPVPR